MPISDLIVMDRMAEENKDIRTSTILVGANKVKAGGHITMGIDADTFKLIANQMFSGEQTYYVALYVINVKQFEEIKKAAETAAV